MGMEGDLPSSGLEVPADVPAIRRINVLNHRLELAEQIERVARLFGCQVERSPAMRTRHDQRRLFPGPQPDTGPVLHDHEVVDLRRAELAVRLTHGASLHQRGPDTVPIRRLPPLPPAVGVRHESTIDQSIQ